MAATVDAERITRDIASRGLCTRVHELLAAGLLLAYALLRAAHEVGALE